MSNKKFTAEESNEIRGAAAEFHKIFQEKENVAIELSDALMAQVVAGGFPESIGGGDIREGVSAEYAPEEYAAGDLSDIDGWDD